MADSGFISATKPSHAGIVWDAANATVTIVNGKSSVHTEFTADGPGTSRPR